MTTEELEIVFRKAVKSVNDHKDPFPADLLLRLYSFYKIATNDQDTLKRTMSIILSEFLHFIQFYKYTNVNRLLKLTSK